MDLWVSTNQHRLHTAICFINACATELTLCPVIEAAPCSSPTGIVPWRVGECHQGETRGHSTHRFVSEKMYDCSGASGQDVRGTMWEFNVNSAWAESFFSVLSLYLGKDITYTGRQLSQPDLICVPCPSGIVIIIII